MKKLITARSCGQLYLLINDTDPSMGRGEFISGVSAR